MIDESLYTGKYNPDIPNFIQANEACKLLEEGVCSLEECDTAMELGYNMEGPIHYIQRFGAAADRRRAERGCRSLRQGNFQTRCYHYHGRI